MTLEPEMITLKYLKRKYDTTPLNNPLNKKIGLGLTIRPWRVGFDIEFT
jgi:hypothetical protein